MNSLYKELQHICNKLFAHKETVEKKKKKNRKHDMGKKATGWKQQNTLECVLFAI